MSKFNYSNALIQLISSLSKAEKRYFNLYSKRNCKGEKNFQFVVLFEVLEKYLDLNQRALQKALPGITPKKLSDLKRHLYHQLLECLRIFNAKNDDFQLPSKVELARILYNKGLFFDSLEILKKVKAIARVRQRYFLVYEIIDFEKEIESRHVTRSHSTRTQELEEETDKIRKIIRSEADWSEFALKMYAKFLQIGHIKNLEEFESVSNYFNDQEPEIRDSSNPLFFENLYRFQAYGWYNYIIQNFATGYRYSRKWIQLFDQSPAFSNSHPHLLIKGLHNCLSVLFYCMDRNRHKYYLDKLQDFFNTNQSRFNQNTSLMAFTYLNIARLNSVILSGHFSQSQQYLVNFEKELTKLDAKIDNHRLMVFWYKMASIYFTMGDHANCIRLLNKIINPNQKKLREDVQCFARLLNLIAHFELENDELLSYLIKSTYRFLLKMNEVMEVHELIIRFLKISLFTERKNLKNSFIQLKIELEQLSFKRFEKRSFLYLDIISWLESKIENKPVEVIIYNNRNQLATTKLH